MSELPTVSVIISTFNYAAFIVEAIESVLAQTQLPEEIIVVDDGSTDATPALVAPYVERGLVQYVWQDNQGPSAARNLGVERSTGELIGFLDADDTWLPDKLQAQRDWLVAHPRASMVSGAMIWWHVPRDTRRLVPYKSLSPARMRREVAIQNVVGNPSMALIRRSALDAAGPQDTSLRWGQDWELFIRLSRVGPIGFVEQPVIVYRWHRGSLSHEGRMEQLAMNHSIARRAIGTHEPRWERPILRARAWSLIEFDRARIANREGVARGMAVRHSALALASWPFDDTRGKLTTLTRSLIGESTYLRATETVRSRLRRARSVG